MADVLNNPEFVNEDGSATQHFKDKVMKVLRADKDLDPEYELQIIETWGPFGAPTSEPQAYYEAWSEGLKTIISERKASSK
jgi:hypothetical protein